MIESKSLDNGLVLKFFQWHRILQAAYQNFATTHENSLSKVYVNIYSHFSKQRKLFFFYLCHVLKCSGCNSVLHVCVCVFYRYLTAYTQEDFPLQLKLRQNVNLEAKVESKDKRLSVLPDTCYATPTPSQNGAKRALILKNG